MKDLFDPTCDPNNPVLLDVDTITAAYFRIKSGIVETTCVKSHLSEVTRTELYIKKEFLQFTGSFKERGARNFLMCLSDEQKQKGVVTASSGNHAQAVSYHGLLFGIKVHVVMPVNTQLMKIEKCKKFNAHVILEGASMKEAKAIAMNIAAEKDLIFINGYDNPDILAGAGTIGLEIMSQVPDVDAVILPIGGGSLIAGVSTVIKALSPNTKVIGVESEKCASYAAALEAGHPVPVLLGTTLADGLAVPMVGYNSFFTSKNYIDKLVVVQEEIIAMSILALLEQDKCVTEGAGATPLAALLAGALPELRGKKVVIVLSGGNIGSSVLGIVLERGLVTLGRLIKFHLTIKDKADGGLSDLLQLLKSAGAAVKNIDHERAWVISDVFSVKVEVTCETRGIYHAIEVRNALDTHYDNIDFSHFPNACTALSFGL